MHMLSLWLLKRKFEAVLSLFPSHTLKWSVLSGELAGVGERVGGDTGGVYCWNILCMKQKPS